MLRCLRFAQILFLMAILMHVTIENDLLILIHDHFFFGNRSLMPVLLERHGWNLFLLFLPRLRGFMLVMLVFEDIELFHEACQVLMEDLEIIILPLKLELPEVIKLGWFMLIKRELVLLIRSWVVELFELKQTIHIPMINRF